MNDTKHSIQIATPYYGTIARSGHGYENIYIIANASTATGKIENIRVETWNGRSASDLSHWLSEKKIDGIIAQDFSLALEKELDKANIWSRWNVEGDIQELSESQWAELKVA